MVGDRIIVQGVYESMLHHSKIASTYGYYFSYEGSSSISEYTGLNRADWGISHADELIYLMNSTSFYPPLTVGTKDYEISEYFVNLWTNFATFGYFTLLYSSIFL
jgi:carboxylesterase type B